MNVAEANAWNTVYRALLGERTPDDAAQAAELLADRAYQVLHAGPQPTIVGAVWRAAATSLTQSDEGGDRMT